MPLISNLHIGDHSFENARITPISGPLRKEDEAIVVEKIAEGESLTEEQAIQRFKCPFTQLTEISIGESCFFRTVVLFIHSAFPAIFLRVDIKHLRTIRIGRGSFHDLVTVNLSCGCWRGA